MEKYSDSLSSKPQLQGPALSNMRESVGLGQAALSEMEAGGWLVMGWRLRPTQGDHLVSVFQALSFFYSSSPHQLSFPKGALSTVPAGHSAADVASPADMAYLWTWPTCGHGLTCGVILGPAPGPGAPAARGQVFSLWLRPAASLSLYHSLPCHLSFFSVPQRSGNQISVTQT